MKRDSREYTFEEWVRLAPPEKLRIRGRGWNPKRPEIGEATRAAILSGFGEAYPELRGKAVAGTAFFSRAGWSIGVVVVNSRVRVPTSFDVFPVVKGVAIDGGDPWRSAKWLAR